MIVPSCGTEGSWFQETAHRGQRRQLPEPGGMWEQATWQVAAACVGRWRGGRHVRGS